MSASVTSHERLRSIRGWMKRANAVALALCLTIAAAGCGSKAKPSAGGTEEMGGTSEKAEPKSSDAGAKGAKGEEKAAPAKAAPQKTAAKSGAKPAPKSGAKTAAKPPEEPAPKPVAAVGGGGSIDLVDRGCVSFEPHWTTIRVGQSITWHSKLKKSVTIHVPPGAFERTEYVVPARGTVHTGPAQDLGDHAMWAMPAACQAAPHGVQGAGPGVTVEGR